MIDACNPSGTPSLARDVLARTDCLIGTQIESGYNALFAPGSGLSEALTIGLTIYVAIIGYRLILGQAGLTLGELVPHFVKIGVVLALATSWPSYQALVFDVLFNGPEQLASPILRQVGGAGATSGDVLTALQGQIDTMTDYATDAWGQRSATVVVVPAAPGAPVPPPPFPGGAGAIASNTNQAAAAASSLASMGAPQFVSALLWLAAAIMLATSVGLLLVVRILLALLLVLGPVFVAFALFSATRGVFEGWLKMTLKFALVPLFTLPMIAAAVVVLAPFTAQLGDGAVSDFRNGPVPIILVVVLVFAAVMLQLVKLSGGIAGSIRLPRGRGALAPAAGTTTNETRVVAPAAQASRAEMLVQTLRSGGSGARAGFVPGGGGGNGTPEMLTATRRIAAPGDAGPIADSSGRLGQSYRRLAIGSTAVPARGTR